VPAFTPPAAPQAAPQPRQPAPAGERAPAHVGGPVVPPEASEAAEIADVGEIAARLDQGRLAALAEQKARQAAETVQKRPRGRPRGR
jgi:hypothetical protein